MSLKFAESKSWLIFVVLLILINISIILDIPFFRQTFGFIFLTIIPGMLIVRIFNLNEAENLEKLLLTVGLSLSFVLFFGFFINKLLLSSGYKTPLSTIPILVSFNVTYILLSIIISVKNKDLLFSFSKTHLSISEKLFLIVPLLLPVLSILGMDVMNKTSNNFILISLILLMALYLIFVCSFHHLFTKRIYPIIIFLMSISLLMLLSLRSSHIIGTDSHFEYYFFHTTLDNLSWSVLGDATLNSCLSVSLLPSIYQSILNVNPEILFKILYPLIYSISPVIVYVISKKYIEESYAFLASVFFMFQILSIYAAANTRTVVAILFFAFAMLVLFNDKISLFKRKILFIIFMTSCLVSHYSTTYIFFIIMLLTCLGTSVISYKYSFQKNIKFSTVLLFFVLIFFWYSLQTAVPFDGGIRFLQNTFLSLNNMFVEDARSSGVEAVLGANMGTKGIAYYINFISNWATILLIGIGVISSIIRYKEIIAFETNSIKADFLKNKISVEYFVIAIVCTGILFSTLLIPHLTKGYEMSRIYGIMTVIMSIFFVIGGIVVSKRLKIRTHLLILFILIPYFFATTGINYAIFDKPQSIILSSEGSSYDVLYVYDKDTFTSQWLKENVYKEKRRVYSDQRGRLILTSQGLLDLRSEALGIQENQIVSGYIYLRYNTVINKQLPVNDNTYTIEDKSFVLSGKSKIYNNGCEIYV